MVNLREVRIHYKSLLYELEIRFVDMWPIFPSYHIFLVNL